MTTFVLPAFLVLGLTVVMTPLKIVVLVICAAVVLGLVAMIIFAREVLRHIAGTLLEIGKLFLGFALQIRRTLLDLASQIAKFAFRFWSLTWALWCHLFAARWKIRFYLRSALVTAKASR